MSSRDLLYNLSWARDPWSALPRPWAGPAAVATEEQVAPSYGGLSIVPYPDRVPAVHNLTEYLV
jgi:hypothetical protein